MTEHEQTDQPGAFIIISRSRALCKRCGLERKPRKIIFKGPEGEDIVWYDITCGRCGASQGIREHALLKRIGASSESKG